MLTSSEEAQIVNYLQTVRFNKYIKQEPTDKQALFLLQNDIPEVFFGGSAGPGKSSGLLMAGLQYVHEPNYSGILFRKTYRDLALPGALMDRSKEWLINSDAKWKDEDKTWVFPSGATLTFGYLDTPNDKYRYQGAEFQFIGIDELTQIREEDYLYLHSRLRRSKSSKIPLRVRATSNPGGKGHEWVKQRFIVNNSPDRVFIPALMSDNPYLDQESYIKSLSNLDPITRSQLLEGDWDISVSGTLFRREWFPIVQSYPPGLMVRYWDMAATENGGDWTAGCLMCLYDGRAYILDMQHFQGSPAQVEAGMRQTAEIDGKEVSVRWEEEGGSSGKIVSDHLRRHVLLGWDATGIRSTGSKINRSAPLSSAAEAGNVMLLQGQWNKDLLDELMIFPQGEHDDQVDACSGAYSCLTAAQPYEETIYYEEDYEISPI